MVMAILANLTGKAILMLAAGRGLLWHTAAVTRDPTIRATILADTNRDGRVDGLDVHGKHRWTSDRGAIFLPNIGDQLHRCYTHDAVGSALSNQELAACNDAAGDVLINSTLAAPAKTMPLAGLLPNATGRVLVQPARAAEHVRVFWRHGNGDGDGSTTPPPIWALVQPELSFNSTALASGLTLAVDARRLAGDAAAWDGLVNITFEVADGARSGRDFVAMRLAPVLVHHHLQAPDAVITMQTRAGVSSSQSAFVAALGRALDRLIPGLPLLVLDDAADAWAQDFMEPAFASMPGPDGPVSIRVLLRSAQSTRLDGRRVFEQLRGAGVGGWQPTGPGSGFGWEEINSGGNIEAIPPYTSRSGVRYANGRVILGKHFDKLPALSTTRFLDAQREQAPLFLEAGWLAAGHVDEMVQFLPSDGALGFRVAVPDSRSAMGVLRRVREAGHGSAPFLTYAGDMTSDGGAVFAEPGLRNTTVDHLLSDEGFVETSAYGQGFVDRNVAMLLAELPVGDAEVLRVPALWRDATLDWPGNADGTPPRIHPAAPGERQLQSLFPLALNGLVLGRHYIAAKPFGPVVDGVDVLEREIGRVYAEAGMNVVFVDDYMSHHARGGEIHCGTNTLRRTDVEWWKSVRVE